jgi:hypothetical protein
MGGCAYLFPPGVDLSRLIINALSNSTEEPTSVIHPAVIESHQGHEIYVISIFSRSHLLELEAAIAENMPFKPKALIDYLGLHTSISVAKQDSGVVEFRYGGALAIAFVPSQEIAQVRVKLAIYGLITSRDSLEMIRQIYISQDWTIFDDVCREQVNFDDLLHENDSLEREGPA